MLFYVATFFIILIPMGICLVTEIIWNTAPAPADGWLLIYGQRIMFTSHGRSWLWVDTIIVIHYIQFQEIYIYIHTYTFSICIYTPNKYIYIYYWKKNIPLCKCTCTFYYTHRFLNINPQCRHVHSFFMSPRVLSHRSGKPIRPQSAQRRSRQLVGHSFFGRYEPPPKCGIKS